MDEYVAIPTPDHVTLDFELAGLGSRAAAVMLDLLICGIVIAALSIAVLMVFSLEPFGSGLGSSLGWAALILVNFLILWGYHVFFEAYSRGQTPGKRAAGIRVLRVDGRSIGLRESAIRNLLRTADLLPTAYFLGGIVASASRRGQRLGDMAAGTIVVREKLHVLADFGAGATWAARVERGQSRHAVTLPRGVIGAEQVSLIESYAARCQLLPLEQRSLLAWQIVEPLLDKVGLDPQAVARHPQRTLWCEQILAWVLQLARQDAPQAAANGATVQGAGSPAGPDGAAPPSIF